MSEEQGRPLPKFGEWDVNDPASADGFTVIFNKARDEKKTGGNIHQTDSPGKEEEALKSGTSAFKPPVCGISNKRLMEEFDVTLGTNGGKVGANLRLMVTI